MEEKTEASTSSCEFLQRYAAQIVGQLGCWDRLVVTGTLVEVGYSGAVEKRLHPDNIRWFDPKHFAEPLREAMSLTRSIKALRAIRLDEKRT